MNKHRNFIFFLWCLFFLPAGNALAGDTLNVMVLVTNDALKKMGGEALVTKTIESEIDNVNRSFVNDNISGYVKLVYRGDVDSLVKDMQNTLATIEALSELQIGTINDLRDQFSVDVVFIITADSLRCGVSGTYGNPAEAIALVNYKCLGPNFSMARELGYLLGCGNVDGLEQGRFNFFSSHSYGYTRIDETVDTVIFTTIMGYTDVISSFDYPDPFKMIPYWSSADTVNVRFNNMPVGDVTHNNALQIKDGLKVVSAYRTKGVLSGLSGIHLLEFQLADYSAVSQGYIENGIFEKDSKATIHAPQLFFRNVIVKKGAHLFAGARVSK